MTLVINGDEYTATRGNVTWNSATQPASGVVVFTFNNVEIEKSGKVQVLIDIDEDAIQGGTITFKPSSINKSAFSGSSARYTDAKRSYVKDSEVKGSISFASKVTIQPSKASLTNTLSKRVEFTTNDGSKKTVFDGVYTAKKGTVKLNTALITGGNGSTINNDATFYLYIDGEEVATLDPNKPETFSDIEIEANESVKVKVEAEINTDTNSNWQVLVYTLELSGDDDNGNSNAGSAKKNLVDIKVVEKGTFSITNGATKDTVLLKKRGESIAQFTIKPTNSTEGLSLEDLILTWSYWTTPTNFGEDDIRLEIDGTEYTLSDTTTSGFLYDINEEIPAAGWKAEIFLEKEVSGPVTVTVAYANGLQQNKTFKKYFAEGLAYIASQQNEDSFTQYFLGVDLFDEAYTITGVAFYKDYTGSAWSYNCSGVLESDGLNTEVDDNDDFTINNDTSAQTIKCIEYYVNWTDANGAAFSTKYTFTNKEYADFFKDDNGSAWRVWIPEKSYPLRVGLFLNLKKL